MADSSIPVNFWQSDRLVWLASEGPNTREALRSILRAVRTQHQNGIRAKHANDDVPYRVQALADDATQEIVADFDNVLPLTENNLQKVLETQRTPIGNDRTHMFLVLSSRGLTPSFLKSELVKELFFNGRCYGITCVIHSETVPLSLAPGLVANLDLFVTNMPHKYVDEDREQFCRLFFRPPSRFGIFTDAIQRAELASRELFFGIYTRSHHSTAIYVGNAKTLFAFW